MDRCGPLPYLAHSQAVNYTNNIGIEVTIECDAMYRFYDGRTTSTFLCIDSQQWLPANGVLLEEHICEGMHAN